MGKSRFKAIENFDPNYHKELELPPLLRLAFRPFFLSGSLFAILAISLWLFFLLRPSRWQPFGGPLWWHSHEMIFGFTCAFIVGFLLTAVQTWTKISSIKGYQLLFLWGVWFLARVFLVLPISAPNLLVSTLDLLFLPLSAWLLARPLWKVRQKRNYLFVVLLSIFSLLNAISHYSLWAQDSLLHQKTVYSAVFAIVFLMTVLAGRVFPMFTANGTGTTKIEPITWLEKTCFFASLILIVFIPFAQALNTLFLALFLWKASLLHLYRMLRWKLWITLKNPLLWSLHLSYLFLVLGYFLCGLHFYNASITFSNALHALTVGAMGLMILAMVSRVSLGHTGRELKVPTMIGVSFFCLLCALFFRVLWIAGGGSVTQGWTIASLSWSAGYLLFFLHYWPILSRPRIDGKPG